MNSDMLSLQQGARLLGVELGEKEIALFDLYQSELLKWNARINLISENTAGEIVTRHFLDSLSAAKFITFQNARLIDIGCGAGFPGIPLKIALPSIQLSLLETNRKKVSFLKHIIRSLNLDQTQTLHDRTENVVRTETWKAKFDVVISRAAFKLPVLLPLGDYFLAPGGLLIQPRLFMAATLFMAGTLFRSVRANALRMVRSQRHSIRSSFSRTVRKPVPAIPFGTQEAVITAIIGCRRPHWHGVSAARAKRSLPDR